MESYGGEVTSYLEIINGVGATVPENVLAQLFAEPQITSITANAQVSLSDDDEDFEDRDDDDDDDYEDRDDDDDARRTRTKATRTRTKTTRTKTKATRTFPKPTTPT